LHTRLHRVPLSSPSCAACRVPSSPRFAGRGRDTAIPFNICAVTGIAETIAAAITAAAAVLRLPLVTVILTGVASVVLLRMFL